MRGPRGKKKSCQNSGIDFEIIVPGEDLEAMGLERAEWELRAVGGSYPCTPAHTAAARQRQEVFEAQCSANSRLQGMAGAARLARL